MTLDLTETTLRRDSQFIVITGDWRRGDNYFWRRGHSVGPLEVAFWCRTALIHTRVMTSGLPARRSSRWEGARVCLFLDDRGTVKCGPYSCTSQ